MKQQKSFLGTNPLEKELTDMKQPTDENIVHAWQEAKQGKSFVQALEERGYRLASGYTGLVVIDPQGKIFNPTRHLDGVNAKAIRKMAGAESRALPDATALSREIQQRRGAAFQEREEKRLVREAQIQNRLQNRQLEERAAAFHRLQTHIEKESDRLIEHYQIKEQREGIKTLEEKLATPSWWRRITGETARDWKELEQLYSHFDNAVERMDEEINHLEARRDQAMDELTEKHQSERETLSQFGGDGTPNHAVRNPARSRDNAKKSDRDFER
jgi:hypothetical protein